MIEQVILGHMLLGGMSVKIRRQCNDL